jgi:hypothetical protein
MKSVQQLRRELYMLTQALINNTLEMKVATRQNNLTRQIELGHARAEITVSIMHRQNDIIKILENQKQFKVGNSIRAMDA